MSGRADDPRIIYKTPVPARTGIREAIEEERRQRMADEIARRDSYAGRVYGAFGVTGTEASFSSIPTYDELRHGPREDFGPLLAETTGKLLAAMQALLPHLRGAPPHVDRPARDIDILLVDLRRICERAGYPIHHRRHAETAERTRLEAEHHASMEDARRYMTPPAPKPFLEAEGERVKQSIKRQGATVFMKGLAEIVESGEKEPSPCRQESPSS